METAQERADSAVQAARQLQRQIAAISNNTKRILGQAAGSRGAPPRSEPAALASQLRLTSAAAGAPSSVSAGAEPGDTGRGGSAPAAAPRGSRALDALLSFQLGHGGGRPGLLAQENLATGELQSFFEAQGVSAVDVSHLLQSMGCDAAAPGATISTEVLLDHLRARSNEKEVEDYMTRLKLHELLARWAPHVAFTHMMYGLCLPRSWADPGRQQ